MKRIATYQSCMHAFASVLYNVSHLRKINHHELLYNMHGSTDAVTTGYSNVIVWDWGKSWPNSNCRTNHDWKQVELIRRGENHRWFTRIQCAFYVRWIALTVSIFWQRIERKPCVKLQWPQYIARNFGASSAFPRSRWHSLILFFADAWNGECVKGLSSLRFEFFISLLNSKTYVWFSNQMFPPCSQITSTHCKISFTNVFRYLFPYKLHYLGTVFPSCR